MLATFKVLESYFMQATSKVCLQNNVESVPFRTANSNWVPFCVSLMLFTDLEEEHD